MATPGGIETIDSDVMDYGQVRQWIDDYVSAWQSGDRVAIGDLFTEDARYGYRPWDSEEHTVVGRDAIVDSWLESPDDPSTWRHPTIREM